MEAIGSIVRAISQKDMVDEGLLRRFDFSVEFPLPEVEKINELVQLTLKNGEFKFDKPRSINNTIESAKGLSYYSIQKTLVTAIKRSLFNQAEGNIIPIKATISTDLWKELITEEKEALKKK